EEILEIPELGFAFIGPSDLSVQMGHPTNKQHPDVTAQVGEIRELCLSADVPLGGIANDPDAIEEAKQQGYQIIRLGGDLSSIQETLSSRLDAVRGEPTHSFQ
ncbi:aldolase/citrate lyase family protein, partial [Haloferax profundi]|uniref:aldolase/citrate lyase family protein n=1 Tax=Haloferax profundi TaxID=1544718 RepID=UPI000B1B53B1